MVTKYLFLQEIFPGQSSWEHNHCRNPEGDMEFPICFIAGGDYDICVVPDCEELEVRRREVTRIPEMCRRHKAFQDRYSAFELMSTQCC